MHLRALGFITVFAAAASASGQSPTPVARFFPFQSGARWTFHFRQSIEGVVPNVDKVAGSWSDTVSSVRRVSPSLQIIAITRTGTLPQDFGECPAGAAMPATIHFWYIVQPTRLFVRCTEADARSLAAKLSASPAAIPASDDGPVYVLPFRVGAFWGNDPGVRRDDAMYRWNVIQHGSVTVPAGRFDGCFEISYDTMPDDEEDWVCPRVGLVEQDYDHHGTVNEITIKLTAYQPGPAKSR
jgi:hypothetical protein